MLHRRSFAKAITIFVFIVLYLPIAVLAISSFNASRFSGSWEGFTIQWYKSLFHDQAIWHAFLNSIIVALYSSIMATLLGTLAALSLHRYHSRLQSVHHLLLLAPLMMPDILLGICLLFFFISLHVQLSLLTVFIAHTTFSLSYVAMIIKTRLDHLDRSIIEAAKDLGASSWQIFNNILFPFLYPAIMAGWLLAFTISLDDFVITFFVVGPGASTLPIYVYSMMKFGAPPVINALSTLLITSTAIITSLYYKYSKDTSP